MKEYLKEFNILTDEEIEEVLKLGRHKILNKGDFFIKEGDVSNKLAFVSTGIFRSFYYLDSGEEVTYCFTFPSNLITAYSSYISKEPTEENIQALTAIELFVISKSEMDRLVRTSTNWLLLFKILAEQQYILLEKRIFLLQKEKAEKKYEELINNTPEYVQQIPLHYLASYLGITQRHLSRIRKTFSN
ncbi:Crp/Fnr family transcriptional regulator [Aquimarina longa]|uniref:Crp/Fnr family transcriptional regulator n=1 Tax=Aquimarina longa TaxID=1080221 RepID=UPI0007818200|nr:Crp/Fnr family transcriptional regulator [Aquimarina longa]